MADTPSPLPPLVPDPSDPQPPRPGGFYALFDEDGPALKLWNSAWVGVPLWILAAWLTWHWYFHIPSPGKAIAGLAVVAGVMSVREIKVLGKISWVVILISMVVVEFRAIDKDRHDAQVAEDCRLAEERASFSTILTHQQDGFRQILQDDNANFTSTIQKLIDDDADSRRQFSGIMDHEEKLAAAQSGILTPGNTTTPDIDCRSRVDPSHAITVIAEQGVTRNYFVFDNVRYFSHI